MSDCLFCKIAARQVKAEVVRETEDLVAFRDIRPQAPTHVLVVPKRHVSTLNELSEADAPLIGRMFLLAKEIARAERIDQTGYRTVFNVNRDAGQTVFHIHLHLLGGRTMSWPPG
ncbi:MAG: histidine triad nucleotide-binding protein [Planctomycetota bacterium]